MIRSVADLTPQQRRIATLLVRSYSYAEIGVELGISHHTVRTHVRAMAAKIYDPVGRMPHERVLLLMERDAWEREKDGSG